MKLIPLLLTSGLLTAGFLASSVKTAAAADCNAAGFAFTSCIGSFELGNGQNDVTDGAADNLASQKLASGVFDGITDWSFNSKINVGGGETTGAGKGDALGYDLSYNSGATTGQFTFGNIDLATTNLAISMKSATNYSIFYFKAGSLTSSTINWDMFGVSTNKKGMPQGLSHASVYYSKVLTPDNPPPVDIPEPTSLLGLAAVVGLGTQLKRKLASN